MGKRITLVDDLDASLDADATITFSLESTVYEIDLSNANIAALKAALAPFIAVARKIPKHQVGPTARAIPRRRKNNPDPERDEIRYWASKNGYPISDKGRIPVNIMQAYLAAQIDSPQFSEA